MLLSLARPSWPAEEAPLLTITGHLIDRSELLQQLPPSQQIAGYYALLPAEIQAEVTALQQHLGQLLPDYQVAFNSADTAELNGVMAEAGMVWAGIRTVHAQQFTPDVVTTLTRAYGQLFPFIATDH